MPNMESPFKSIKLKYWPDFLLAISGSAFVVSLVAMYSGIAFAQKLSVGFFGFVLFGIGGRIAHYQFRGPSIRGNNNAWFSGWRHSPLADFFAIAGIVLVAMACWAIFKVGD